MGNSIKNNGDYYCINCLHSFRTKNKLKSRENLCKNHDYCYTEMPQKGNNVLKHSHEEKFIKVPFVT